MASTTGRRVVEYLTNKSGGGVVAGDVVVIDSTNDESFTTTTSAGFTGTVGVAQETIANNAAGRVLTAGYAALVTPNASVTRGNYGKTHTVAKQATDAGASRVSGAFCQFLTGGTTPSAHLFGVVDSSVGGSLTDHTHAVTGSGATGGGATLNPVTMKLPTAMGTTEGQVDWDTTGKVLEVYDSQRERGASHVGWAVRAVPMAWDLSAALTTAATLAANGGSIAIPVEVPSHMLVEDVGVRNVNVASARTWGWDLYVQDLNNGNAGENTVRRVAASTADDTFTPGAASTRFVAASGAPVYIPPGVYWLVIQCRHATNSFDLGSTAVGVMATNTAQTKTTTNPNGATLDLVAATWTKVAAIYGVMLRGRVLGNTSAF